MAKSFLVPITMNNLEIRDQLVHLLPKASEPTGTLGQIYTDSTNNLLMFYGTSWNKVWDDRDVGAHLILAGPVGSTGAPTFRSLVADDIPDLSAVYAPISHDFDSHSGDLDITDLGSYVDGSIIIGGAADWTTLGAGTSGYVLTMGASRPEWSSPGAPSAHALLGTAHSDTATATASRGSLIYGNSTPAWDELVVGTTGQVLQSDGTDVAWGDNLVMANSSYIRSGDSLGDTLLIGAYDVDGASPTTFITITSNNTPTMDLSTSVTIGSNAIAYAGGAFHDGFSDSIAGEHFLQSEITAVATSVGDGIMTASTGTLGVLTGSSSIDTVEDTLTEDATHIPTSNAVYDAIASAVAGGVSYQGAYDASANSPDLETPGAGTVLKGYMYTVTVAGDFFTDTLAVGDVLIAENDNPSALIEWTIVAREWDETFLELGDTPAVYTGSGGYMVMVNSTPDAVEFVDPSGYGLSNFSNDLESLDQATNGGISTFSYDGSTASVTVGLDLSSLSTVTTMEGADLIPIYDDSVTGTRNISMTNFASYVGSIGSFTKKYSVDCAASTSTVVNHALATRDLIVSVYDTSTYDEVECDIVHTDTNNVTVTFAVAPSLGEYRIVVIG